MECMLDIPEEQIKGLLCSALEGGSYYWCRIKGYDFTGQASLKDFKKGGPYHSKFWHHSQVIPLVPDCSLKLQDILDRGQNYVLNRTKIAEGMRTMARKYPRHFSAFFEENYDATTGDVFLQCCLFGEVVYG